MTNTEAIKILDGIEEVHGVLPEDGNEVEEALNMAIKALQEQADRNEFYNWDAPIRHKADGEYISRKALLEDLYKRDYTKFTHRDFVALVQYQDIVAIPPEHDGCKDCRWQSQSETEMPCKQCKHNYTDEWEREKPTDTITMTREEFSEKLMEHYRQGRADEKAYQNGEIMQSFNPD